VNRNLDLGGVGGGGVDFIGINSKRWPSTIMAGEFSSLVNYTIYQSTQKTNLWGKIGGMKDDVFVYDR
jgi:hypothetical protein